MYRPAASARAHVGDPADAQRLLDLGDRALPTDHPPRTTGSSPHTNYVGLLSLRGQLTATSWILLDLEKEHAEADGTSCLSSAYNCSMTRTTS